ncbi:MAG TPA: hypothetical protein VFI46_18570 [Jiangellaceae bacterium]|nr:hypothetical protein [Jiangellaceae bacterium]
MIGLLGAEIWIENRVNFANPVTLVPIAAGIIIAIGAYHFDLGPSRRRTCVTMTSVPNTATSGSSSARIGP